jgi:hypothetical protein
MLSYFGSVEMTNFRSDGKEVRDVIGKAAPGGAGREDLQMVLEPIPGHLEQVRPGVLAIAVERRRSTALGGLKDRSSNRERPLEFRFRATGYRQVRLLGNDLKSPRPLRLGPAGSDVENQRLVGAQE